MRHTPGPWTAYSYAINTKLITVCDAEGHVVCNVVDGHRGNAAVLAAAPLLLEACGALIENLTFAAAGSTCLCSEIVEPCWSCRAHDAIVKGYAAIAAAKPEEVT